MFPVIWLFSRCNVLKLSSHERFGSDPQNILSLRSRYSNVDQIYSSIGSVSVNWLLLKSTCWIAGSDPGVIVNSPVNALSAIAKCVNVSLLSTRSSGYVPSSWFPLRSINSRSLIVSKLAGNCPVNWLLLNHNLVRLSSIPIDSGITPVSAHASRYNVSRYGSPSNASGSCPVRLFPLISPLLASVTSFLCSKSCVTWVVHPDHTGQVVIPNRVFTSGKLVSNRLFLLSRLFSPSVASYNDSKVRHSLGGIVNAES